MISGVCVCARVHTFYYTEVLLFCLLETEKKNNFVGNLINVYCCPKGFYGVTRERRLNHMNQKRNEIFS